MAGSTCGYDCSSPPNEVPTYPDISGIGVVIGYTATAGFVVLLLVIYYFVAYDPNDDPLPKRDASSEGNDLPEFKPNPFDVFILTMVVKVKNSAVAKGRIKDSAGTEKRDNRRLRESFIKCVLAMSDLQILTGLSILISGYAQLRCGLSCYYWQVLVCLAWFSSLTHLSCLTALRNYLYHRPEERLSRVAAMGIIVIMLRVALVPTGNYNWTSIEYPEDSARPNDFAICYFNPANNPDQMTYASMIVSILLLSLAFCSRVVKLSRSLSVGAIGRIREKASSITRDKLRTLYDWCDVQASPNGLKRSLIYRPLLAMFLALRVGLDAWSSMFVEVWWLISNFIWGVLKLTSTLYVADGGNSDWAFGQVVSVVLLGAPLLAIAEYLYPEAPSELIITSGSTSRQSPLPAVTGATPTRQPSIPTHPDVPDAHQPNPQSAGPEPSPPLGTQGSSAGDEDGVHGLPPQTQTLQPAADAELIPPDNVMDSPDHKYYTDSHWLHMLMVVLIGDMLESSIVILVLAFAGDTQLVQLLIPAQRAWEWLPINVPLSLALQSSSL